MSSDNNINEDFERAIGHSSLDVTDLIGENGEVLLDSVLEDGVLKEIPIIGNLVGIAKAYGSIRERFQMKKIITFLYGTKDVTQAKKEKFEKKYLSTDKDKVKFYEKLLFIIDKCDDLEKAKIIAHYFKALIYERIDLADFLLIVVVVENTSVEMISGFLREEWVDVSAGDGFSDTYYTELQNNGVIYISQSIAPIPIQTGSARAQMVNIYKVTTLGTTMLKNTPYV